MLAVEDICTTKELTLHMLSVLRLNALLEVRALFLARAHPLLQVRALLKKHASKGSIHNASRHNVTFLRLNAPIHNIHSRFPVGGGGIDGIAGLDARPSFVTLFIGSVTSQCTK